MKKVIFYYAIALTLALMTGCKDEYEPQPPKAVIENPSGLTSVETGVTVSLRANVTSDLTYTVTWSVDGQAVAGANGQTFDFSSDQTGEHTITLTVENKDGKATDQITILVYYVTQPPQAAIENLSEVTTVAQGESVSLKANITSALTTTITWSVDGQAVAGANGQTFDFSSDQAGEHTITLTVENKDGKVTDQITILVYYQIDFEGSSVLPYVATANSGSGVFDGGYIDEGSGLKMPASVNPAWGSWSGVAISQYNDMSTEGYTNQLSVYYEDAATGFGGYKGSKTFAVNYNGQFSFDDNTTECPFYHIWVTNSTYAALSMKNGDSFAKKFSYEDNDWFKLTITAEDKEGNATGTAIDFYLADFRTATSPGILTEWTKVDLTPLGSKVHTIKFNLESSDVGQWGMNTPAYFCFDNLAFLKQ